MAKTPRKRKTKRKPKNPLIPRHREGRAIGRSRAKKRALGTPPAPAMPDIDGPRMVRLNKLLADHGIASRRKCDEMIAKGKVSIDGEPVTELGTKVDPDAQVVEVGGVTLKGMPRRYYVLNKPGGVVCTNEERETRPRAVDLITDRDKGRIYTVGRLDEESTGLILLTNDGDFANRVMHPRYGVHKTYSVRVAGRIDDDSLNKVREGVHLAEGRTGGARILVKRRGRESSTLDVTIREGMNREIRRAFAGVGYKVVALRRTHIGPLNARGLKTGRWRKLKRAEIEELLNPPAESPISVGAARARKASASKTSERKAKAGASRTRSSRSDRDSTARGASGGTRGARTRGATTRGTGSRGTGARVTSTRAGGRRRASGREEEAGSERRYIGGAGGSRSTRGGSAASSRPGSRSTSRTGGRSSTSDTTRSSSRGGARSTYAGKGRSSSTRGGGGRDAGTRSSGSRSGSRTGRTTDARAGSRGGRTSAGGGQRRSSSSSGVRRGSTGGSAGRGTGRGTGRTQGGGRRSGGNRR